MTLVIGFELGRAITPATGGTSGSVEDIVMALQATPEFARIRDNLDAAVSSGGGYTEDDRLRDAETHTNSQLLRLSEPDPPPVLAVEVPTADKIGCVVVVCDANGDPLPDTLVKLVMDTPGNGTGRWYTSATSKRTDELGILQIALVRGASYYVLSPSGQILTDSRFTVPVEGERFDLPKLKIR